MVKLKLCPFCGGKADSFFHGGSVYSAGCSNNLCLVEPRTMKFRGQDGERKAISAWNKRT